MQNVIGKTILWIDDESINYKCIHFTDGSFIELSVETAHAGLGLQGIHSEYTPSVEETENEITLIEG